MPNNDLISRAAAKKEIDKLEKEEHSISPSWFLGLDDCRDIIDCIPAVDAVPVVRCKDCIYWNETEEGCGECERLEVVDSDPEIIHAQQTVFDWFCADGERRCDNDT